VAFANVHFFVFRLVVTYTRTLGQRVLIPGGARSVRLNDKKSIYLLLSCGFFVFFCNES